MTDSGERNSRQLTPPEVAPPVRSEAGGFVSGATDTGSSVAGDVGVGGSVSGADGVGSSGSKDNSAGEVEAEPVVRTGQREDDMGRSEQDAECSAVQEAELLQVSR